MLTLLTLLACQTADEASREPEVEAPPDAALALGPPAVPPPAPAAPRELCPVLAAILAADAEGYAPLRANPVAAGSWLGSRTLPGTERCTIEGDGWPRARYACTSRPFPAADREGAEAAFEGLAGELDGCLSSPIWFPRDWQRGEPFRFALGERLQTWTDQTTAPPSQVVLKMQQDLDRSGYQLKLSLEAVR
jgi:hypothetical protein